MSRLLRSHGLQHQTFNPRLSTLIIDYAHSPDGLEKLIHTAKGFAKGRVITLFGCGGDRDKTKRAVMGEISGRLSDYTIITSDNPRTEVPFLIIGDIYEGIKNTGGKYCIVPEREKRFTMLFPWLWQGMWFCLPAKAMRNIR